MTKSKPSSRSGASKMVLRKISVVMTSSGASGWIVTSPVMIPTFSSPYCARKSRNFWFERALIGLV